MLPSELWIKASEIAVDIYAGNAPALQQFKMAFANEVIPPQRMAVLTTKYWGPGGIHLTVGFMDNPPADLRVRILSHMNAWNKYANVKFSETSINPDVRITRGMPGYWSYLGTDIRAIKPSDPTMCLQGFTMSTPDSEFYRVVRHEAGHTLGFPHEHTRTEIVNAIDHDAAVRYFKQSQNWDEKEVERQVLTPLDSSALIATAQADPKSIMCYWLPGKIMKDGKPVPGGNDISPLDAQFAASIYPKSRQQAA